MSKKNSQDIFISALINGITHGVIYLLISFTFFACIGKEQKNKKKLLLDKLQNKVKKGQIPERIGEYLKEEINNNFLTDEFRLKTIVDLPWNIYTKEEEDTKTILKSLSTTHEGLKEVKNKIVTHLFEKKFLNQNKCLLLYGCYGNGKTTLAQSIAKALNRNFVRISLAGAYDVGIIRGFKKTYHNSSYGRIIAAIKASGSMNPLILLDEVDKMGVGVRNDNQIANSLLELLDPQQNKAFHDNFIDIDFDISNVLFIATANDIKKINPILLDRLKILEIPNYSADSMQKIIKKKFDQQIDVLKQNFVAHINNKFNFNIKKEEIPITANFNEKSLSKILEKKIKSNIKKCYNDISIRSLESIVNNIIADVTFNKLNELSCNNFTQKQQILNSLKMDITIDWQKYIF